MSFTAAPENLDKMTGRVMQEVQRLQKEGPSDDFVTRAKENVVYQAKKRRPSDRKQGIIRDEVVVLGGKVASAEYPGQLRRVTARVDNDKITSVVTTITPPSVFEGV